MIQTASHWGTYHVKVEGDAITDVQPFARDTHPSPLIHGLPAIVRGATRIARPAVRAGYLRNGPGPAARGSEPFVEVSWDRALALIAAELERVREKHGDASVYGGSYGWASAGRLHHSPSLVKRFLGLGGGFTDKLGNHSFGAALGIMPHVIGSSAIPQMTSDWPSIAAHTRLMVMFGGAPSKNMQIDSGGTTRHNAQRWLQRVREAGVEFVLISPCRGDLAPGFDPQWLPIRPTTDVALMLALSHVLLKEGLADRAFLDKHCVGHERFAGYLADKTPAWAAQICDIPADSIVALARRMAATRTLVAMSWSVQRCDHGEQPCWALVALAALLGQIGLPGGGFGLGYGSTNGVGGPLRAGIPRPKMLLGPNPVKDHVPVGRVLDMLLEPGASIQHNGRRYTFPDIRLLYSSGGNPFHHNGNLNKLVRAWQRPDTVVVHEPFWTPAAKHADIVLPSTTTLERNDILAADRDDCYAAMKQAMPPVGEARNDFDVFAELADRLGYRTAFTESRDEMQWLRHMYETAAAEASRASFTLPGFDEFWERGFFTFPAPEENRVFLAELRAGQPLKTPSGKIELWSETVAGFGYADCPGHPAWLEPAEWLGASAAKRFPLHLLSHQPRTRLHSQLDPAPLSRASKVRGREPLSLHPDEAAARGLAEGDLVEVFNDRGCFHAAVRIDAGLRRGVALIATGAWYDPLQPGVSGTPDKHGNPNLVTLDKGTSALAQGSSVQSVLVEVRRLANPPPVTAFDTPRLVGAYAGDLP